MAGEQTSKILDTPKNHLGPIRWDNSFHSKKSQQIPKKETHQSPRNHTKKPSRETHVAANLANLHKSPPLKKHTWFYERRHTLRPFTQPQMSQPVKVQGATKGARGCQGKGLTN